MLQHLPVELLEAIIEHLPSKKDRRSLWAVSARFRKLLVSRVFETLTIRAKDNDLLRLDKRPYKSLDANHPLGCLKLVKHLHLKAPFLENLDDERCPHAELYGVPADRSTRLPPNGTFARVLKLIPLLSQLQENGLISFSWDLGLCIPGHVLGREGYLTRKHTAIESLSVITTAHHDFHLGALVVEPVVLTIFPQLRKFSWKGLRLTEQLNSLRGLFASNYRILEDIELDFVSWDEVMMDEKRAAGQFWQGPVPSFTHDILPQGSKRTVETFRSLKRLALSDFGFEDETLGITQAFNIPHLQALKLHNCYGIQRFLSTIVNAGLDLKLKSLELIIDDNAVERNGLLQSALIRFLESFQGLEDLYLMRAARTFDPLYWPSRYWDAILLHSSTLKKLIYHERVRNHLAGSTLSSDRWVDNEFEPLYNPNNDYNPDARVIDAWNNQFYNRPLAELQLECFGIADNTISALSILVDPSSPEKKFKLLHFRRTGTDPHEIHLFGDRVRFQDQVRALVKHDPISWSRDDYLDKMTEGQSIFIVALEIFQSSKFNNLQILAFGDFSHNGRYKWCKLLLCRAVTPNPEVKFRVMTPEDFESYKRSGLLDVHFLTACPRSRLIAREDSGKFP